MEDEIKITEEMIKAGMGEYSELKDVIDSYTLVQRIFVAMTKACPVLADRVTDPRIPFPPKS